MLRGNESRRDDQITFILAILIIDQDHHLALKVIAQNILDWTNCAGQLFGTHRMTLVSFLKGATIVKRITVHSGSFITFL
jgi:cobalamin-dependent methionine synthase I